MVATKPLNSTLQKQDFMNQWLTYQWVYLGMTVFLKKYSEYHGLYLCDFCCFNFNKSPEFKALKSVFNPKSRVADFYQTKTNIKTLHLPIDK